VDFKDNTAQQRYELLADGEVLGFAQYRRNGGTVTITHTEIGAQHEGKGYGSALARQALDHLRAEGEKLVPACAFIAAYVSKHPEYADLTAS
jgi:predicted GNAT family acetyltransferase